MKEFYHELAEILEVDKVHREDKLNDFSEWDSLGVLSVISMIDEMYDLLIESEELKNINTVGELENLLIEKKCNY